MGLIIKNNKQVPVFIDSIGLEIPPGMNYDIVERFISSNIMEASEEVAALIADGSISLILHGKELDFNQSMTVLGGASLAGYPPLHIFCIPGNSSLEYMPKQNFSRCVFQRWNLISSAFNIEDGGIKCIFSGMASISYKLILKNPNEKRWIGLMIDDKFSVLSSIYGSSVAVADVVLPVKNSKIELGVVGESTMIEPARSYIRVTRSA